MRDDSLEIALEASLSAYGMSVALETLISLYARQRKFKPWLSCRKVSTGMHISPHEQASR